MSTLCLLCGMPFSGKTTLGKSVAQYLNCPYISLDEINEARGLFGGDGISIEEWEKTHSLAMQQLQVLMQSPGNIVLDDTSCFRWLRDRFRNFAATYNYRTTIIFINIPLSEIWRRMENNKKNQVRHQIKPEIIREMTNTFELPQSDEDVIEYSAKQPIEEFIISNFSSS